MKYIILIIIVIICGYLGYGLSLYYNNRLKFFRTLLFLFEKINLEINFSQAKLISILKSFHEETNNKEIKKLINNFIKCLEINNEVTKEDLFNDIKILNNEKKNMILIFFLSLGKFDVFNQTKQLDNQKEELNKLYSNAEQEAKKYAPLYLKLGIIFGLAIALILL